jgi:hypothetical protein
MTPTQINAIKILAFEAYKAFQVKKFLTGSPIANDNETVMLLIGDYFERNCTDKRVLNKLLKQLK